MPKLIEDDDKEENLSNFDDFEPGKLPPEVTAPPSMDGKVPRLPLAPAIPLPPAVPEHFVCLRGPCKHYLEIRSPAELENRGVGYLPEQISRYCRAISGAVLALDDDAVFGCSEWDPRTEDYTLKQRREQYMKANPACSTADAERIRTREEVIAKRNAEADAREAEQRAAIAAAEAKAKTDAADPVVQAAAVDEWAAPDTNTTKENGNA